MRNFDECKQEILHRAEVRIQHRKKVKKQLLGIGIPALCLAVCLSLFLGRGDGVFLRKEHSMAADAPMADAPAYDMPAADVADAPMADAPAADAPLYDHAHEEGYCDCTGADAPADPQLWEIPPENTLTGTPGETFTEYEGVSVRVESLHLSWGSMVFEIWNQSGEYVHFSGYGLLRQEAGQWVSCAVEGSNWRAEPMELPSYQNEAAAGLSTTWKIFDFTQPGLYRYVCTFRVGEDDTEYTMWAEFALEEAPLALDQIGAFGSEYPGVYLELFDVFPDQEIIHAFWRNETALPARIYEGYDVQYLDGDTWVSCKKEFPQFGENIYALSPYPSHLDVDYPISSEQFDLSRAGEYRLTAQFWVEGDETLYTAWAWFTLG